MNYRHFTLIIVGNNPDQLVEKYDNNLIVDPYIVYYFKDREKYRKQFIESYENALTMVNDKNERAKIISRIDEIKNKDDVDFYVELTDGYIIDDKTGDAYSRKNINGRYDSCTKAKHFAVPLINLQGDEVFSERKKNIDWKKIHLDNQYTYEFVWDSVMNGLQPKTEEEKTLYENMKNRSMYLEQFKTRENYLLSNTSFWGYAFLSEKTGWIEPDNKMEQFEWVKNFYDRFIKPLGENELINVYECVRN